jgi:hypothetical protein
MADRPCHSAPTHAVQVQARTRTGYHVVAGDGGADGVEFALRVVCVGGRQRVPPIAVLAGSVSVCHLQRFWRELFGVRVVQALITVMRAARLQGR